MPFRRAKLTACRRVRAVYRRHRAKSSRYGHETAMAQGQLAFSASRSEPEVRRERRLSSRPPQAGHAGSMPLARMIRTTGGDARKATKARAEGFWAAVGARPAEYSTKLMSSPGNGPTRCAPSTG
jgi:hypothetical protein